ncbi:hypothetical protein PSU4_12660 [Pseudonocardia sulfidoxydans NBRC 16205]|uniref:SalK n=1 Tax=Pseudonocardia sulfidoxydans NBRC 16205 TaxID=1223511 RepID=A0A511DBZ5_9PSEU|nr:hypothetical protein [Pseudonocardia sulfidoxydans]GEL22312.1 hypothetical protein PSU4_12660 [Pseudonocardia sulfidoxydans NBRC 16205]
MASTARRMWTRFEPVHDVTYFAPEALAAADAIGMRGFWMGYVALRAAPLGAVGPAIATAAFHGFHPSRLERALPSAWDVADPTRALAARLEGVDAALRAVWGADVVESPQVTEAADLAWAAATAADTAGRVLAAANQALPRPDAPHLALWQATTTLREHRGDGHIAVLVARGISPLASHLIKVAADESDPTALQLGRRFTDDAWQAGLDDLRVAGVVDTDGRLTDTGRTLHDDVEAATDDAAEAPWQTLGPDATARLAELLTPLAAAVARSGMIPEPNPVGIVGLT